MSRRNFSIDVGCSLTGFIWNLLPGFVLLPGATSDWQFKIFVLFIVLLLFSFTLFSELELLALNNKSYLDVVKTVSPCQISGLFLFCFRLITCKTLFLELHSYIVCEWGSTRSTPNCFFKPQINCVGSVGSYRTTFHPSAAGLQISDLALPPTSRSDHRPFVPL